MSGTGSAPRTLQGTRGGGVFNYLPLTTTFFMACCLLTFLAQFFLPEIASTSTFSIMPVRVVFFFEWYRLVSSAFFHGGLMHIGFNMMSLYAMGTSLERQLGSMQMFWVTWILLFVSTILYVTICVALWAITGMSFWLFYSAVGYSGVLFGMAVQESALSFLPTRSVFGCFNVPTVWYPWVLMAVLQVVMPNVSLLGHLCGALAGFMHIHGYLSWISPSLDSAKVMEEAGVVQCIVRRPNYVLAPASQPRPEGDSNLLNVLRGCCGFALGGIRPIVACVWNGTVGRVAPGWALGPAGAPAPAAPAPAPRSISNGRATAPSTRPTRSPSPPGAGDVELGSLPRFGGAGAAPAPAPVAGEEEEVGLVHAPPATSWPSALIRGEVSTRAQGYAPVQTGGEGEDLLGMAQAPAPGAATAPAGLVVGGAGPTVPPASRGSGRGRLAHSRLLSGK